MNINKIHLKFEHPLLHNIKQIYLRPNNKVEYTNLSYLTYYTEIYNSKLTISFSALFKDSYLVILIDTIDKELNNSVSHKNIIFIKADWSLIKINNELYVYELNIIKNKKYKYFNLPLRKFFNDNNDLSIDDILLIHDCIHYDLIINKKEEKNNQSKNIHQNNSSINSNSNHELLNNSSIDSNSIDTFSNIKNKLQYKLQYKLQNKLQDKLQNKFNKLKDFIQLFHDD